MRPKVHYLLRVALSSSILLSFTTQSQLHANDLANDTLSESIANSLNQKNIQSLINHLPDKEKINLENRYKIFIDEFPDANWVIKKGKPLNDGRDSLEIFITGAKKFKREKYIIQANQRLGIKTLGEKVIDQELISEETIIQTSQSPLSININVPNFVLTGTTYDFDIILNKPLGDAMLIGGLIPITDKQIRNQSSPPIELAPLGGGGLFKSVKAPLSPGIQNWAAVVAHPEGLISITKMVRVVADESDIEH